MGQTWLQKYDEKAISAEDFEVAKRRLEVFNAVLISEYLSEGMQVLEKIFGLAGLRTDVSRSDHPVSGANVSKGGRTNAREELEPDTLESLERKNVWDTKLYEHARLLFHAQHGLIRKSGGESPES